MTLLAGRPDNVVFDLDGVIFLGSGAVAGAAETLEAVRASGSRVVFATNNGTKTEDYISERITSATGFTPQPGSVLTSAMATADLLRPEDSPILVMGESGLEDTLRAAGHQQTDDPAAARSVVVGLDRSVSYERVDRASAAVRRGARFVATNTDPSFPIPGGAQPGAGAFVAAVATAAGRRPEIVGKPHPPMIRSLRRRLASGPTWVVGDRPETDLALARCAGWFGVLVLTGVTGREADVPRHLAPDLVIASVADLAEVFAEFET